MSLHVTFYTEHSKNQQKVKLNSEPRIHTLPITSYYSYYTYIIYLFVSTCQPGVFAKIPQVEALRLPLNSSLQTALAALSATGRAGHSVLDVQMIGSDGCAGANCRLYMPGLSRLYMPGLCRLYMQGLK